ncbi:hypothetical protein QI052_07145 [Staphylococcus saprophyticus]|nr:hypothetical protein [Staphylococcus saprophyticus]
MLRTVQELEDKYNISRHFEIAIDDENLSDEAFDEISHALSEFEQHLVIVPSMWADHTTIEID